LTVFLLLGRDLINLIPYSVLGAVLVYTGYRLCRPSVWRHIAHIGPEQLMPFTVTLVVTVCTDLLVGIGVGIVTKLAVNLWLGANASSDVSPTYRAIIAGVKEAPAYFRNPVIKRERTDGEYHVYFGKPLVCFNVLHLNRELELAPPDAKEVVLHITEAVLLVDHTACDKLFYFIDERNRQGRTRVQIVGLENLARRSEYRTSMRLGTAKDGRIHRGAWGRGISRLMATNRLEQMHAERDHAIADHDDLAVPD
jgi:MFS superfamily sulfate permease-like transporter